MNPPTEFGKSYWEIVTHAFRKNWGARVALWISGAMIVLAIVTPLLANDRPYAFYGTMPGEYRKAFSQVTRGAFMAIVGLPGRFGEEREKFQHLKASRSDFLRRTTEKEATALYDTVERLRTLAEHNPDIRARWVSGDVTMEEMYREMTEAEKKAFEAARLRILRDLPKWYGERLQENLAGIHRKLRELTDQLEPALTPMARILHQQFAEATSGDYLNSPATGRGKLQSSVERVKAELDPEKVRLVAKWRLPLFDSLGTLDVLFVVLTLLAGLAFGPLKWWRLDRIAPLERRWTVTWLIAFLPAAAVATVWQLAHDVRFETVSYKRGVRDGSVVMERSAWPPIRHRYDEVPDDPKERLQAPSSTHWFGTDYVGRDLLSRMLWGSRISLSIGFVSTAIALAIGILFGVSAGYFRGWVDIGLSRVIEWMISFPIFFLILAVVAFLPPSIYYVMLVLGIFGWMGIARLQRGEILRLVNQDFVQAARALGVSVPRLMFRHLLPNALAPVLVAASFGIASAMLTESALSFLGFGVQEPATSWGQILFTGRDQITLGGARWWTFTIPGFAIFLAVTCYNLVGDGVRDAVDPRLKT